MDIASTTESVPYSSHTDRGTITPTAKPKSTRKQRNKRGDPLLHGFAIVGDYPTPTDGSAAEPRNLPSLKSLTTGSGGEQIDQGEYLLHALTARRGRGR